MSDAPTRLRLGDICHRVTDGTHQSPKFETQGVPFLVISDVVSGEINWPGVSKWVSRETYEANTSRCRPERGDVLYTAVGSFGVAVPVETDQRFTFQRHIAHIKPDLTRVDSRYLSHVLNSPAMRHQADRVAKGVAQRTVTLGDLKEFEIPLPPLPEQKRIAAILDKADAIRRKRQEAIRLTEVLLRSAFLEMCGPLAKNYSTWPLLTIESLASSKKSSMRTGPFGSDLRHSEFVDEGIAVLGIDNAVQNRFAWGERRFITEDKYERLRRYTVFPNDVIVTIMGTTGRTAVVPKDIPPAITTKHLATITLNREVAEPEFVAQALHRHPEVLSQIANAHRGAIMSGLNLGLIKALQLRVPPLREQQNFAKLTAATRLTESRMRDAEPQQLGDSLTQLAFSGRL